MIGLFKSGKRPASWSWDNDWFISSPEKDQQVDLETMIGLFWVRKKPTTSSLPTSREQTTPTGGVVHVQQAGIVLGSMELSRRKPVLLWSSGGVNAVLPRIRLFPN